MNIKLSLNSIILYVQDVDRLKEFYIDILNFKLIEETKSEWALLKAGFAQSGFIKQEININTTLQKMRGLTLMLK
ncbi:MAG: VOC family protein [Ignavibacteria bacterium]|nr:VOC family protein [Ignavibacteria bacterium]